MSKFCLTLICPREVEEKLLDTLLTDVEEEAFTSTPTHSHGTAQGSLSNLEKVLGRSRSVVVPAGVLAPVGLGPGTITGNTGLDFLGTVRGRVGFAFDRFMVYGTGGFAYGGANNRLSTDFAGTAFDFTSNTNDDIRFGWAAGVGAEYAFANLILGVEYLHYDLGRDTVTVGSNFVNTDYRTTNTGDLVRGRLSFKF